MAKSRFDKLADDYVIVDRGNYRVRVHKKNLDKHSKETMSKIHNEANQKGLMYDEETGNYIPLNAESFEAESRFDKLADKIAAQYRKKGYSAKRAMEIGKATAYKIGVRKYGKAGMASKARRGMRKAMSAEGILVTDKEKITWHTEPRFSLRDLGIAGIAVFIGMWLRK